MDKTLNNIIEAIGNTPMVRMNKLPEKDGIKCQIFAKCEFMNPGGSIKDRIGFNMLDEAKKEGKVKTGDYVIESTSGNTGIGLAMTSVCFNMKSIITIPDKMSKEKVNLLKSLGSQVYVCDTSAPKGDPNK